MRSDKDVSPGSDITAQAETLAVNLIAVLVAVTDDQPRILTVGGRALPSGPFELAHRSLQSGLRDWVEQQTRHPIGYVEQLYTFADRDRGGDGDGSRMVSISYLGLTRERPALKTPAILGYPEWRDWYAFFPWEDRRRVDDPRDAALNTALQAWAGAAPDHHTKRARAQRCAIAFGFDGHGWNEDLVLQRYELLFEAALIPEARLGTADGDTTMGSRMTGDHRRILATGMARLRAKIKYRPVVFELLPETFTLLQLQRSVEALAGRLVHKQNFRRLIEQQNLVEDIGAMATGTGGRPAKLVRFRRDILDERAMVGTKLPRP